MTDSISAFHVHTSHFQRLLSVVGSEGSPGDPNEQSFVNETMHAQHFCAATGVCCCDELWGRLGTYPLQRSGALSAANDGVEPELGVAKKHRSKPWQRSTRP
jgi:hypothetical protein